MYPQYFAQNADVTCKIAAQTVAALFVIIGILLAILPVPRKISLRIVYNCNMNPKQTKTKIAP
jgi:hypothetical protein